MSTNLPTARHSALSCKKGKGAVRPPLSRNVATSACRLHVRRESVSGLRVACAANALDLLAQSGARSVVDYQQKAVGASNATGASHDATVLSVLQNYSGLTQERLFNMLRNSGRFNENQSTLSFILNTLTSQGRVLNESGTYRFVPATRSGRSPSPAPSSTARNSSVASTGNGTSATDEVVVLSVLQNYSGLTQERLSGMLRSSGKSIKTSLSSVLNGLVSQGKVQNDNGTYRYLTRAASPVARTSSATPARVGSPVSRRPSSPVAGTGNGASASDEAVLLSVLQNYSGLTQDRLSGMLRSSGKSVRGSVSSLLSGLVSQGKVQNDNGTYRYLTRAASPAAARTSSSTPSRVVSPVSRRPSTPVAGSGNGASASDEAVLLSVLQNYSGLTQERMSSMLRSSGKSLSGSVASLLSGLVSQGKVQNDNGTYRYLSRAASPAAARSPARTSSSTPSRVASPVSRRSSTPVAGSGNGASATDAAVVLSVLQNYSGLTQERLSSMLRSSGKSVSGSVSSLLSELVSQGKVQNDNGTYRYLTRAASPAAARASSSTPSRAVSPVSRRPSTPVAGSGNGASASDEAVVLSVLKNYSGLTQERLSGMLRSSGKTVKGSVSSILSGLVQKGKLTQDRSGVYRM